MTDVPKIPNHVLRCIREEERQETREEFAVAMAAAAKRLGEKIECDVRTVARWEDGDTTKPYPAYRRVLSAFLGRPFSELGFPVSARAAHTSITTIHCLPGELGPGAGDGGSRIVTPTALIGPQARSGGQGSEFRESGTDTRGIERLVAMSARRAFQFGTSADASNTGQMALEQLRAETARLAVAYEQNPLPEVIGDIVALQDQAFVLLEGRQRPGESRELYVIGGLASGLLAKCANDLADPQNAMTHARAAVVCSENAEFPSLTAWVRGIQCLIAYWAGSPHETIRYAQLGSRLPGVEGSVTVWLHSLEARAWAALGNSEESQRAVGQANRARDEMVISELDELGGFCYYPRPRQLYYAAGASALIPDQYAQAEAYANEALAEYEVAPTTQRAWSDVLGTHTDLAVARVHSGDLEGTSEAIRPVLDLPIPQRIHGVVVSVRRVHQAITASEAGGSLARGLQEEIEAYCRTPAASLPR
jgi:hypothetical protein